MRNGFLAVALVLCGCSMSKEARMGAIGDTLARAVAERDEQRLLTKLAAEGWEEQQREARLWKELYKDLAHENEEIKLENRCLRDSIRRQDEKLRCAELDLAEARRQVEVLNKRLLGSCFSNSVEPWQGAVTGAGPSGVPFREHVQGLRNADGSISEIIMPSPADLGIDKPSLPSIKEKVEPLVDEPPF